MLVVQLIRLREVRRALLADGGVRQRLNDRRWGKSDSVHAANTITAKQSSMRRSFVYLGVRFSRFLRLTGQWE